ncbi:MAG: hypothetical protein GWN00_26200, partial [Aliifodinibius sp.]|nr:hypothetical protein [Phycisphaerae bacterium]NIT59584.1 hypothetical protein [Fodinibius sp.]NIX00706.1 hypothetical protein [Phycisphaerae bacterium]NIY28167.1 hypothetical protein [Fodinibius sp.]
KRYRHIPVFCRTKEVLMADICLVEPKYKEYDFTYVPTGLLSLAAKLMEYGHNVDVYYCNNLPKRYNIIGISSTFVQYCNALDIARRAFADVTILGGAYVTTDAPAAMKSTLFDYGVIGDGEDALAWLVRGKNPERIPGVVYKRSGAIVINPNLDYDSRVKGDRWPIPAYSCFVGDVGGYINITKNREYVWNWGWQRRNRPKLYRDFQKEVSELLSLGVRGAYVTDENFGSNPGGLRLTVEALDRFESWRCRSTVDEIVNRRLDLK